MKIEVTNEVKLDGQHDTDQEDELKRSLVTIEIKGERAIVRIDAMIKALETMKER